MIIVAYIGMVNVIYFLSPTKKWTEFPKKCNIKTKCTRVAETNNRGYGLELTDWSQKDHSSYWLKSKSPSVKINGSNFIDNYKTTVLDKYRYKNIWSDWKGVEYTGDGWIENWKESIYREIPFGRLGWIGFQYNSNNAKFH